LGGGRPGALEDREAPPRLAGFEEIDMDVLMVLGTIVFFVVAIAYTAACDRLK